MPTFYEFFAGGGMARAGLGEEWRCLFSNDFDAKKAETYRANWGDGEMWVGDIHDLPKQTGLMPGHADLAWASFPCQDLSLAGNGAGLAGERSGAFWGFHDVIAALDHERRKPSLIVIENVIGLLTANDGRDFETICRALHLLGYQYGALVMDARHFLPQSRPRLFIVAVREDVQLTHDALAGMPSPHWTSSALARAHAGLQPWLKAKWRWWNVAAPPAERGLGLEDLIDDKPNDAPWHGAGETARLIAMMSPPNLARLEAAIREGRRRVGTIYRRTRFGTAGNKVQRAELRLDGLAGCLRTPGGGSSRQFVMVIEGRKVRSRLLSSREAARLMGLQDSYMLPASYNDAYHLAGDGLAVPVVAHLGRFLVDAAISRSPRLAAAE